MIFWIAAFVKVSNQVKVKVDNYQYSNLALFKFWYVQSDRMTIDQWLLLTNDHVTQLQTQLCNAFLDFFHATLFSVFHASKKLQIFIGKEDFLPFFKEFCLGNKNPNGISILKTLSIKRIKSYYIYNGLTMDILTAFTQTGCR